MTQILGQPCGFQVEETLEAFERDGFIVLEGALSPAETARYRSLAAALVERASRAADTDEAKIGINPTATLEKQ